MQILVTVSLLVAAVAPSSGCGISTHTEVGYRAVEYLGYAEEVVLRCAVTNDDK